MGGLEQTGAARPGRKRDARRRQRRNRKPVNPRRGRSGQTSEGARAGNAARRSKLQRTTKSWGQSKPTGVKSEIATRLGGEAQTSCRHSMHVQAINSGAITFIGDVDCLKSPDSTWRQPSPAQCAPDEDSQPNASGRTPAASSAQWEVAGIHRSSNTTAAMARNRDITGTIAMPVAMSMRTLWAERTIVIFLCSKAPGETDEGLEIGRGFCDANIAAQIELDAIRERIGNPQIELALPFGARSAA